MTPWHLTPTVLDTIAAMRRHLPLRVETRRHEHVITTDEWQAFNDPFVSSLAAWRNQIDPYSPVMAEDVAAAVSGQRLRGVHWIGDDAGLDALRAEIDAAMAARWEEAA